MNEPTLHAPPLKKRIFTVALCVALGAGVLASYQRWFSPWLRHYLGSADRTNVHERLQNVFGGLAIFILVFSGYLLYVGVRAVSTQQWPLPGTFVLRETPVRTGRPAIIRGFLLIALALFAAALAVFSAIMPGLILRP
jgi:hypothetical protein